MSGKNELLDGLATIADSLSRGILWLREHHPEVASEFEKIISQEKTEKKPRKSSKRGTMGGDGTKVSEVVAHYCDEWKARYGMHPAITGSAAGGIRRLVKDVGAERAKGLISAYLRMNDQWFLKKRHDILTLIGNVNAVTLAKEKGVVITAKEAQRIETLDQNARVLSRWLSEEEPIDERGTN